MTLPPDPVYVMKGDMGPVHSLMFYISPDVEHLYAGAESGTIHIWNLKNNRQLCKLQDSNESCLSMKCLGDNLFVTQRKGGKINFWKSHNSTWTLENTFNTDYYGFCKSQTSSENTLYIPLGESKIGLFSVETLNVEIELNPKESSSLGAVMGIKPCFDKSQYVLVIYDGGKICLWDLRSLKVLSSLKVENSPMCIDFNSTLRQGYVGSPSDNLEVFELTSNHQLVEKKKLTITNPGLSVITVRPDDKLLASGGWDSRIRIFSSKSVKPLAVLDQHKETIHDLIYSNCMVETYNSKYLMAVAGKEGNISLWNIYNK